MTQNTDLSALAPNGVLRAAINTGNRALVQGTPGDLRGVSPALAQRLADEIGARLACVVYSGAGKVFADAQADIWDVGFLAVDTLRAEKVSFTTPYHRIEATFAVRRDADISDVQDVDRAGLRVLTSVGSAYDMYLTSHLRHASLERFGTPPESFAAFQQGRCDAVAGVRASLEDSFASDPNVRILPGVLTAVHQAMALPGPSHPLTPALNSFVIRALEQGFVTASL